MMTWFPVMCMALPFSEAQIAPSALFPTDLPNREWVEFAAQGYAAPVSGVIYRKGDPVSNGMALGGIDTGCMDLETSGLLGYLTLFNSHVPRRGPLNLPFLGLSVAGETWVLCDPSQIKSGSGEYQIKAVQGVRSTAGGPLDLKGLKTPREIRYWGHYPIADLEFEMDSPLSVGLRAWAPFVPGNVRSSIMPAIVFEVHVRNKTGQPVQSTLAFSFPGPTTDEAGSDRCERAFIQKTFQGVSVKTPLSSYALGAIGRPITRTGAGLDGDASLWRRVGADLPPASDKDLGTSLAVDLSVPPGQEEVVRFALTWSAPTWNGVGIPGAKGVPEGYAGEPRIFRHMVQEGYPNAADTADMLAESHEALLKRILSWQEVVYRETTLPPWLRDSLINVLYMMTEDSLWAQASPPVPSWVRPEDGLFGMNECPRGCPQIECIPCSFYGSLPIAYFFPQLELSTLRGYKGYQFEDGAPTWIFGGCTGRTPYIDYASPTRGYQWATNGISLAALVDQFLMCYDTPDRARLKEFYPMVKKNMIYTVGLRTTPEYSVGERILSMPDKNEGTEWFEAPEPGWAGMTAHVGGLHLAQLRIVERMAKDVGDREFEKQCKEWIAAAQEAMEKRLWAGTYYLNYLEPETGRKSDLVFGYQLDGEWIADHHGLPSTLPNERILETLATIKRCNVGVTRNGAVNYANPDGTLAEVKGYGPYSFFPPEALMLAMTYMYHGEKEFGLELARKVWHNLICVQGYTWDMPNIMRGDADTGERTFGNDYYQDMMLWSLPAALQGKALNDPVRPGGLVARIIEAGKPSPASRRSW